tara:strand:+ start:3039 stop:3245 length:207 start_codon:yes stop_codon:yes gene_type:complete
MISQSVAQAISDKLKRWIVNGPDYTAITFSKRGDSIRVKLEMNGSPDEVLSVVDRASAMGIAPKTKNN